MVHAAAETAFVISFNVQQNAEDDLAIKFQQIVSLAKKGLVDPGMGTLSVQGKLLLEHVMKLTPPRTIEQGTERVKKDITKIFRPLEPTDFSNPYFSDLVTRGDPVEWDKWASKLKKGSLRNTVAVIPTAVVHQANRDKRGRAYSRPRPNMVTLKPQHDDLHKLIALKQQNVGYAKAGWTRAYNELRGDRTPEWVQRHFPGKGIFEDGRAAENPFIAAYNQSGWGKKSEEGSRIMRNAIRARTKAMQTYFETVGKMVSEGKMTPFQLQQQAIAEQFQ